MPTLTWACSVEQTILDSCLRKRKHLEFGTFVPFFAIPDNIGKF